LASKSLQGFGALAVTLFLAGVGALWKIKNLKPDTYDRHQERVAVGISALEESAINVLLQLGSKYSGPDFIIGRTLEVAEVESEVKELQGLLRRRRLLQRRFRRMLKSCVTLQLGVVVSALGGVGFAGAKAMSKVPRPWTFPEEVLGLIALGVLLTIISYAVLLYYESRMTDAALEGQDE
jgi:hypothetical protein